MGRVVAQIATSVGFSEYLARLDVSHLTASLSWITSPDTFHLYPQRILQDG
jgi:hypothetical protein